MHTSVAKGPVLAFIGTLLQPRLGFWRSNAPFDGAGEGGRAAADASLAGGSDLRDFFSVFGAGRVWMGTLLQPRNGGRVRVSWTPRGVECAEGGCCWMARAEERKDCIRGEADTGATVGPGWGSWTSTVGLTCGWMCGGAGWWLLACVVRLSEWGTLVLIEVFALALDFWIV